jgi:hypothetical protein
MKFIPKNSYKVIPEDPPQSPLSKGEGKEKNISPFPKGG